MTGGKRLIEVDFPLQQVSIDSVHEKSVRHGHISTLHIWPARRPLAACRAALAATLLPDPQNAEQRQAIYQRLAGKVQQKVETRQVDGKTVQISKPETVGGILHWGREQGAGLDWFRQEIRKAYGGRAPKVLDPFAGGGAIPLEAMRLGCDVTAVDINPVAWFILKCTLEYPQRFAGKTLPLPDFALRDRSFMTAFFKAKGYKGKQLQRQLDKLGGDGKAQDKEPGLFSAETPLDADLAWQIRAWGLWVHAEARKQLAPRYPTYAEFQPLAPGGKPFKAQDLQRLKPDEHGNTNAAPLNIDFDAEYLANPQNPRWVQKTTGAYLWARTVRCKSCRATVPLLKTCWLAKRPSKRVLLTITPKADGTGVDFGIEKDVPREQEARGAGTMSRSGVQCPCCSAIMTMEDIQLENRAGKVGAALTAVCVQGVQSKEYRLPTQHEVSAAAVSAEEVSSAFEKLPFGCIVEKISTPGAGASRALSVPTHGLDTWAKLFTDRQLVALATLACTIHSFHDAMEADSIPTEWSEAIVAGLACALNKSADYGSQITTWGNTREGIGHTFARFALPMTWDFAEGNPIADVSGAFSHAVEWVGRVYDHTLASFTTAQKPKVVRQSAIESNLQGFDAIVTDPPYYDSIPYSDLMDFFYVWLRRTLGGKEGPFAKAFRTELGPKWDDEAGDGELVDDAARFDGDRERSKTNYEDGMARAFQACHTALNPEGRLVVVFANKQPDAWETLVAALIRAGFVVSGSWPVQTELANRMRAQSSAALASSVWLVCKKRAPTGPGWDNEVLAEMRDQIRTQLRMFWDAGIRGPDFIWAATGPALEAFSRYPVVKKANKPDSTMPVAEFLREVRRLVVDFVVGRVLSKNGNPEATSGLDDITTYYLLHRHEFRLADAPIGACILYALSCNLSDAALTHRFDILVRSGSKQAGDAKGADEAGLEEAETAEGAEAGSGAKGSTVKLKAWDKRTTKWLGVAAAGDRPLPLIDQAHRLMHLWRDGDEAQVNDYLDARDLKRRPLFAQLLQALIELAPAASQERSILESLSNHLAGQAGVAKDPQAEADF